MQPESMQPAGKNSPLPVPGERNSARRELASNVLMLGAVVVVLLLARRGVFSAAWFFPMVFGVATAGLALLSLRVARSSLIVPRVLSVLAIVGLAAALPGQHAAGVREKVRAYERTVGEALVGKAAPGLPFVASLRDQHSDRNSVELEGRVSILNFWATWCAPCVAEMPMLEKFWQENRELGIDVIGVTKLYDRTDMAAEVRSVDAFLNERNTNYPILITDRRSPVFAAYRIGSLPSTVLVGRDGKVVDMGAGIEGTKRMMEKAKQLAASGP